METKDAIDALASLAHDTRLQIFRLLVRMGPEGMPAGELAEELGVPNATLSFHLNHLTHGGLLRSQREGRSIIYSIDADGVRELFAFLMQDCCQGRREFQAPSETGFECGSEAEICCDPKPRAKRRKNDRSD